MSHERKLSQFESKCVYEALQMQFSFSAKHRLVFAKLTPSQVVEYISNKAGIAVDVNWVNSAARRG